MPHRLAQLCRERVGGVQVDHGLSLDCPPRGRCPSLARMPGPEPTIADVLAAQDHPTMSFEFFPPKDDAGQTQLLDAITALEPLRPDFISVTYGANGSSRARTLAATRLVQERTTAITMGHLTCVSQSTEELRAAIAAYAEAGVRHVLAVRGDPPGGPTAPWQRHPDGLDNATPAGRAGQGQRRLLRGGGGVPRRAPRALRRRSGRPHPGREGAGRGGVRDHPACSSTPTPTSAWSTGVAGALGCTLPIVAGIMPVTNLGQIERFATLSGADLPAPVVTPAARRRARPVRCPRGGAGDRHPAVRPAARRRRARPALSTPRTARRRPQRSSPGSATSRRTWTNSGTVPDSVRSGQGGRARRRVRRCRS